MEATSKIIPDNLDTQILVGTQDFMANIGESLALEAESQIPPLHRTSGEPSKSDDPEAPDLSQQAAPSEQLPGQKDDEVLAGAETGSKSHDVQLKDPNDPPEEPKASEAMDPPKEIPELEEVAPEKEAISPIKPDEVWVSNQSSLKKVSNHLFIIQSLSLQLTKCLSS